MIGLDLSGCVHKKWVKWVIISFLLPLVFGTYSFILYFVRFSVLFKTSSSLPKCWISYSWKSHGIGSSEVVKFCKEKWLRRHTSCLYPKWLIYFRMWWQTFPHKMWLMGRRIPQGHRNKVSRPAIFMINRTQ